MVSPSAYVSTDCVLERYVNVASGAQVTCGSRIGVRTSVGRNKFVQYANIGKYCSISYNVIVGTPSHPMQHLSMHAFPYRACFGIVESDSAIPRPDPSVTIGNDVWIGCGAIIMSGITVGDGAVIGAGAVVTHDVSPFSIVVGMPAKLLRYRFSPAVIAEIEKLKWWDLHDDQVKMLVTGKIEGRDGGCLMLILATKLMRSSFY